MERRDFLRASCCTGIASLTGTSLALGQISTGRRPGETATEYAQRVARERALAAQARTLGTTRQPNETATEYAQRAAEATAAKYSGSSASMSTAAERMKRIKERQEERRHRMDAARELAEAD